MKSVQTKVVYTAVFGSYDHVPAVNSAWDCDFVCFTDSPEFVSAGWKIVILDLGGESPAQANRRFKMKPHKYLSNYECSLYIDGNIKVLIDPSPLFEKYLAHGVIAIPKHQDRHCAYMEAQACIDVGLVNKDITDNQMTKYASAGFPKDFPMTENGVILRKHNDKSVITIMDAWWTEYCNGAKRDQLSLPYLIWKNKIEVSDVTEGPRINTKYFKFELHQIDKSKSFIKRFARRVNEEKHLAYHFLLLSKLVSIIVKVRDSFRIRNRIHR